MQAAVIGFPVSHSRSPLIHGFWLQRLGLAGGYGCIEVAPDDLAAFMQRLPLCGLRGVNVTVPHKLAVMPCCDTLSETAARVGAVNTIVVAADGHLSGHNTDVSGILLPLAGRDWSGKTAVVIGNGGAARAVLGALHTLSIGVVRTLSRRVSATSGLLEAFGRDAANSYGFWQADMALAGADLLINASSLGMAGQPPLEIDLAPLDPAAVVFDIVYGSQETAFLAQARARHHVTLDGLDMLVAQAIEAFTLFFGVAPPVDDTSMAALRSVLAQ
jgi:shikimate dehydrogenase